MQQLMARIKRSSKYWGQTAPDAWFRVNVVGDDYYHLRGNHNNYRLSDVALGMRLIDGSIVDLRTGKTTNGERTTPTTTPKDCTRYPNGAPMFAPDGMMLDDQGNRSIFDDVDQ